MTAFLRLKATTPKALPYVQKTYRGAFLWPVGMGEVVSFLEMD